MTDFYYTVLIAIVMAVGLVGTVFPFVPGVALIWAAAVLYGFFVGFGLTGFIVVGAMTVIVLASVAKSVLLPRRMAEGQDVSRWSQLVAAVGAVLGLIFIPVVGVFVGALLGLFAAELANHRNVTAARRATVAVAKGFGLSALIEVFMAVAMIGLWSIWAFTVIG
ncbi:MAG: DUF456 domain-containing protein [Actinomycetota bacterium]